ncbi:MAG TPA: ABC transporter, partial [Gammaproteobacteria bacterium]|nr:ABC transporter [Gammaproteobacteria bacterium]
MRHGIILLILFLLTSCSAFSPIKTENSTTYVLNSAPSVKKYSEPQRAGLLVMPVESNSIYNTTQMAYTTQRYELAYF